MEAGLVKQILELGGLATLAIIIFIMYWRDSKTNAGRLTGLLKSDQETRTKHTEALTELIVWLKVHNGR